MEGVEPTTPRLQITCSSQLSYIGVFPIAKLHLFFKGIAKIEIYFFPPKFFAFFFTFLLKFLQKCPQMTKNTLL